MPTAPGNRPKGFLGQSPNAPEPSWSRVQTSLEQRAVSHTTTERCFVIFVVVRKLRYAFCISFYSILLASHAVSSERVHAAKNIRIRGISASQIEPGSVWGIPKSSSGGPVRTAKREKDARRQAIFFMGVRTTPVGTRKCAAEALWGRENAEAPGAS